ncbi:MarR family transcriptional regulator [Fictibacillus phosphorivorans]|uniref:MarR family transcriptional regulator n=1 Tax=Fictibacillus phosphorivorans TaxID=1221500 RepID=UPI0035F0D45B
MTKRLMDVETGEILEDIVSYRTKEQQEAINKKNRMKAYRDAQGTEKHPFYFAKMDKAREADKMLSMKEMGYFLVMQSYISYDNMLKMENDAKLPMTKKELMEVLKIKKPHTVNALVKKFIELGLVSEDKVELFGKEYKAFFINKEYCFRKDVNSKSSVKKTARVFMDNVKELYAEDKIKPADLGFIYRLIPFVNYHHNLITANPYEVDASKDKPLSIEEIAKALDMEEKLVSKKVSSLYWGDMAVFARIKVGKATVLKVNPLVVYRQEGYPPASMFAEFVITRKKK